MEVIAEEIANALTQDEIIEHEIYHGNMVDSDNIGNGYIISENIAHRTPTSKEFLMSDDTIINDVLAVVKLCENLPEEGKIRFDLPKGKKRVRLYCPVDAEIRIKNFRSDKFCEPYAKGLNVLWIGDSITQGAGSFMSSQTYVNIVS